MQNQGECEVEERGGNGMKWEAQRGKDVRR